ncbi:MAG: T9SS type A sorting domain-containing protein [Bacteroidota bacterium]|nr:T9SS type A sorting domain-containing protein [Bacteroidota bacterium]
MKHGFFVATMLFLTTAHLFAQVSPANNIIGVDITLPQDSTYTFTTAFTQCYGLGMREIGLHLPWAFVETAPGKFDFTWLDFANIYYPHNGIFNIPVDLNIDPIETNQRSMPSDIAPLAFDDSTVIKRFKILLDSLFAHIPDIQLSSLVIGSEVDAYLKSDSVQWRQYTKFYSIVSAYAKTKRAGLKVSCEAQHQGLTTYAKQYLQTLNGFSDYIGVSYFPLQGDFTARPVSTVIIDFADVVALYPSKPIYFYQLGYPSSVRCKSSEEQQRQFIQRVFTTWDTYASKITMIDFTWMHDYSPAAVDYWGTFYGLKDSVFLSFLGSIGLRSYSGSGTNKSAFNELICQTKQRGFNSLSCLTGVADVTDGSSSSDAVYPNPASSQISFSLHDRQIKNYTVKIFNILGQEVFSARYENNFSANTISLSHLPTGIYFFRITNNGQTMHNQKMVIIKQ